MQLGDWKKFGQAMDALKRQLVGRRRGKIVNLLGALAVTLFCPEQPSSDE